MRSRKPCSVNRGRTVWGRGRRGEPRLLLHSESLLLSLDGRPRQPQPSCLRSAYREESAIPLDEDGGIGYTRRPDRA